MAAKLLKLPPVMIWENVLVEVSTSNGAIIQASEKCLVVGGHAC